MTDNTTKRLTLGQSKVIAGLCSGIAIYFHQNTSLIRLAVAIACISTGMMPGIVLYLIATWIIPDK